MVEERGVTRSRTLGGDVMAPGGAQSTVTAPLAGTLEAAARLAGRRRHGEEGRDGASARAAGPGRARRAHRSRAGGHRGRRPPGHGRATGRARHPAGHRRRRQPARGRGSPGRPDRGRRRAQGGAGATRAGLTRRQCERRPGHQRAGGCDASRRSMPTRDRRWRRARRSSTWSTSTTVWIRVPLYAGDIALVDRRSPARVVPVGARGRRARHRGAAGRPAPRRPIPRPPAVDLYYAAPNPGGTFGPGERVGVRVPLDARGAEPGRAQRRAAARCLRRHLGLRSARRQRVRPSACVRGRHGRRSRRPATTAPPPAPASSPWAPPNCSAPSSGPVSRCARSVAAALRLRILVRRARRWC